MAKILITSGPTRQYLDPVRFLSNGSSGKMGVALANVAIAAGHDVVVVSGPVHVAYPDAARQIHVQTTQEMLRACQDVWLESDGLIAAAAPCDYAPANVSKSKIKKNDRGISLELVSTPDILATLGQAKKDSQWTVGFALETDNGLANAQAKMARKQCEAIVLNGPQSLNSDKMSALFVPASGKVPERVEGTKAKVATELLEWIEKVLKLI